MSFSIDDKNEPLVAGVVGGESPEDTKGSSADP